MSARGQEQSLAMTAAGVADLVADRRLREVLHRSFSRATASVEEIERCFELLPERRWSDDLLAIFLHSWKSTHLKMLGIYGLSCRIQRLAMQHHGEAREQLWMAAARNAETSHEDLGLDYDGVTHAALYEDMARALVPTDDWQRERHCLSPALEFKRWVYDRMVVDEIPVGLLTNMFSEIYNHAEYTMAFDAFSDFVDAHYPFIEGGKQRAMSYIGAHVGDETEMKHFLVVLDALQRYNAANRLELDYERSELLFTEYLERLGEVMRQLRLRMEAEQEGTL